MQQTINERLKFLIGALGLSARAFSAQLEVPESNTRNYLDKKTKLNSDYLERIITHFKSVDLNWLITGEGEPFIGDAPPAQNQTNISGDKNNVATGKGGKVIQKNYTLSDCEKDRDTYKNENELLKEQLASKDALLASKDVIIASKDDMINLLRASYNRPN